MKFLKTLPLLAIFIFATQAFAKKAAPLNVEGAQTVTADQAKKLHEERVIFLDVRGTSSYDDGRIAQAENLDVNGPEFTEENFKKIVPTAQTNVVIYCNGVKCERSSKAATKAIGWGYKKVYYFRGGFPEWKGPTE